ncbi:hypothetical protein GEV33_001903 [Tenebrio molitor]|uniref:Uncharacterized protein n=1 Tax=Tenebrio molitor TaxID=7067 RepID=A0A8J6HV66_TENMO|nr:hypothetical protein GEV33_001903 [Tenebrio molitor]
MGYGVMGYGNGSGVVGYDGGMSENGSSMSNYGRSGVGDESGMVFGDNGATGSNGRDGATVVSDNGGPAAGSLKDLGPVICDHAGLRNGQCGEKDY